MNTQKLMRVALMLGLCGSAAPAVYGAGEDQQASDSGQVEAQQWEAKQITGKIEKIDPASKELTVDPGLFSAAKNLTVDEEAEIFRQDRQIELSELQPGDEVQVSYIQSGDQALVEAIHLAAASQDEGMQQQDPGFEQSPEDQPSESGEMESESPATDTIY